MRRNFYHNTVVHTRCAFIYLLGDIVGKAGALTLKRRLIECGDALHREDDRRRRRS